MGEGSEKKRKRQSGDATNPSKRVAISPSGTIKVSYNESKSFAPILLSSPGLNVPNIQYKTYAKPLSKTASQNASIKPSSHELFLHSSEHPKLDYHATTSTLDPTVVHYMGIFDPSTNKLQITPVHHLALRSTLRTEVEEVDRDRRTFAELRDDLGREFGTKKMRKAIASRTDNAITQSPQKGKGLDVQEAILERVAEATAGTAPRDAILAEAALLATKPMPQPNFLAQHVEEVYSLDSLIPAGDRHSIPLKEWYDGIKSEEDILFNHSYPANRLKKLVLADEMDKLVALGYIAILLDFHDTLSGSRTKKVPKKEILASKLGDWPSGLVESVRQRFTDDSGTFLGKWQLDNLYTHMAALSLFIDGCETNTTNLKDDLRLENKEIDRYFIELGCRVDKLTEKERTAMKLTVEQAAVARLAKLRLPLKFPKARKGRR